MPAVVVYFSHSFWSSLCFVRLPFGAVVWLQRLQLSLNQQQEYGRSLRSCPVLCKVTKCWALSIAPSRFEAQPSLEEESHLRSFEPLDSRRWGVWQGMPKRSCVPNAAEKRHGTTAAKQCTNLIMISFGSFGRSESFDVGILTAVASLHPKALKTLAP